jgi:uncharacterized membrane protein YhaH (DUF805 family)
MHAITSAAFMTTIVVCACGHGSSMLVMQQLQSSSLRSSATSRSSNSCEQANILVLLLLCYLIAVLLHKSFLFCMRLHACGRAALLDIHVPLYCLQPRRLRLTIRHIALKICHSTVLTLCYMHNCHRYVLQLASVHCDEAQTAVAVVVHSMADTVPTIIYLGWCRLQCEL